MAMTRGRAFLIGAVFAAAVWLGLVVILHAGILEAIGILEFTALPAFLPLGILAIRPVRTRLPWILIIAISISTWGWVIYEYAKPYEGGGANFAAMSGIFISIPTCILAIIFTFFKQN
jgi:hypothetical protein